MKRIQTDLNAVVRQLGKQQTNSNWHVWRLYFRKVGDEVIIAAGNIEHDVTPPEFIGFIGDDIKESRMRTTLREVLPQRRRNETFNMTFGGQNSVFVVTVGFYDDGHPGEVFIDGAKAGSELADITRDGAVLLSLAIQHGVPLPTMRHAVCRDKNGTATTIIGAVIDKITENENDGK